MSIVIPKKGHVQLIGVPELDHFRFRFMHNDYEVCLLPDSHNTSTFMCENNECAHSEAEIKKQIEFVHKLMFDPACMSYDVQDGISTIFKTARKHAGCMLLSNWFIYLGANASTCIDLFVETHPTTRHLLAGINDARLHTIGGLFAFCGKPNDGKSKHIDAQRCRDILPNARFHGVDQRKPSTKELPRALIMEKTARELTIDWVWKAMRHRHEELEALHLPQDMLITLQAIDKQFRKSLFVGHERLFFTAFKNALDDNFMSDQDQLVSFRINVRLMDAYTILRIFNNTWHAKSNQDSPAMCSDPPRNIVYFAGSNHTSCFKNFVEGLKCFVHTIYHISRRNDDLVQQTNCLPIPIKYLPFQHLVKRHLTSTLTLTTDDELLEFMQSISNDVFHKLCTRKYNALWRERLSISAESKTLDIDPEDDSYLEFLNTYNLKPIPLAVFWQTTRFLASVITDKQLEDADTTIQLDTIVFLQWKQPSRAVQEWYMRTYLSHSIAEETIVPLLLSVAAIPSVWMPYIPAQFDNMSEFMYVCLQENHPPSSRYQMTEKTPEMWSQSQDKYAANFIKIKKGTILYTTMRQIYMFLQPLWRSHLCALWTMRVLHDYERKLK